VLSNTPLVLYPDPFRKGSEYETSTPYHAHLVHVATRPLSSSHKFGQDHSHTGQPSVLSIGQRQGTDSRAQQFMAHTIALYQFF